MGIVSQQAVIPQDIPAEEKNAEQLLYEEALNYIDQWNQSEEELASLMQLNIIRPVPTIVTIAGIIDVTYLFDMSTARFMSNKGLWPEDRMESTVKKWYHSDYKTLSYQYTYEFYNRIVDLSK